MNYYVSLILRSLGSRLYYSYSGVGILILVSELLAIFISILFFYLLTKSTKQSIYLFLSILIIYLLISLIFGFTALSHFFELGKSETIFDNLVSDIKSLNKEDSTKVCLELLFNDNTESNEIYIKWSGDFILPPGNYQFRPYVYDGETNFKYYSIENVYIDDIEYGVWNFSCEWPYSDCDRNIYIEEGEHNFIMLYPLNSLVYDLYYPTFKTNFKNLISPKLVFILYGAEIDGLRHEPKDQFEEPSTFFIEKELSNEITNLINELSNKVFSFDNFSEENKLYDFINTEIKETSYEKIPCN